MKFTFSWLKDHLGFENNANEISGILTDLGLEVENMSLLNSSREEMVICDVKKIYKHPNADRLSICEVSSGKKMFTVVCGAKNLYVGMKTVFAPNGSFIPGKNFKLEKKAIRGIEGDGMLCSEEELCISENSEGIIDLDDKHEVGKSFGSYFEQDFIYEVALTPNRGDCASVRGIARELAAKLSKTLKEKKIPTEKGSFKSRVKWDLTELSKKSDCPMIMGREFNIKQNSNSPIHIKNRLMQIGINSNSSLVDITNYLLYDLGRPLHVFDLEKIQGNLKVRRAKSNEKFIGLDNKEYNLSEKDLVIADNNKILSLAGIMGSSNSSVDSDTKKVFLEVAYFDPILIAETGRRHNIVTDARYRFERGIDKKGLIEGLEIATDMIISFCGGSFSTDVISGSNLEDNETVRYFTDNFINVSGYSLSADMQIKYLQKLGFAIKNEKSFITVSPPSWRHDINNENDLIEEIVRLHGYDKIPNKHISNYNSFLKETIPSSFSLELDLRNKAANLGLNELKTFTFISPKKIIPNNDLKKELTLVNPISNELSVMRNSLYPNMLDTVSKNFAKGIETFSLFEIGYIFKGIEYINQEKKLAIILSGYQTDKTWHYSRRLYDFFDIKEKIYQILYSIVPNSSIKMERSNDQYYHPGKSADIIFKDKTLGSIGELHPRLEKVFKIKQQTVLGYISLDLLLDNLVESKKPSNFNLSPLLSLKKDFSFVMPKKSKVSNLIKAIKESCKIIGEILVFDIYEMSGGQEKMISVGVEVEIIQDKKVFNSHEINNIMADIIKNVKKKVNADLRS